MEMQTQSMEQPQQAPPISQGQQLLSKVVEQAKEGTLKAQAQASDLSVKSEMATAKANVEKVMEAQETNDPDFGRKFAALSRREKELFMREKSLKEKEAKFKHYEELDKLREENPFEFTKKVGLDFDKLVMAAAKDGEPPSLEDKVSQMQSKIEKYLAEKEQEKVQLEQERITQAIDNFKKSLQDHIKSKADDYELITAYDAHDMVFKVIEDHFKQTLSETGHGETLGFDQAAQKVEELLENEAKKLVGLKKFSKFMPQPPEPPKAQEAKPQTLAESLVQNPVVGPMTQTLSSSAFAPRSEPATKHRTLEEREREAAALIRWK